jgi:hypothetical protein
MGVREVVDQVLADNELRLLLTEDIKTGTGDKGGYALFEAIVRVLGRLPTAEEGFEIVDLVYNRLGAVN